MEISKSRISVPAFTVIIITLISCFYVSIINRITWHALLNILIYILIAVCCYICALKIYKSYKIALATGIIAAILPIFANIFPIATINLISLLSGLLSVIIYSLADSSGLKRHQGLFYTVASLLFFTIAVVLSGYALFVPVLLFIYEFLRRHDYGMKLLRLLPFGIVMAGGLFLVIFGIHLY